MIQATIGYNANNEIVSFSVEGHAGYDESGRDIVCAAVSVLVLNTINAIEEFTSCGFSYEAEENEGGFLRFSLTDVEEFDVAGVQLLLKTLVLGLSSLVREYKEYMTLQNEEV